MELARQLNFHPVDMGTLSSSRDIERMPIQLFPGWKGPVLAAVAISIFFFAYSFVRDIIHPYVKYKQSDFYKIPIEIVNQTLPTVAITLLALVYLAGQLAAVHQLYYGTKYRHFPHWLEGWLQSRKQLGLLSFFLASVHVLYSLCLPMRRSERYLLLNTAYQQVSGADSLQMVTMSLWFQVERCKAEACKFPFKVILMVCIPQCNLIEINRLYTVLILQRKLNCHSSSALFIHSLNTLT